MTFKDFFLTRMLKFKKSKYILKFENHPKEKMIEMSFKETYSFFLPFNNPESYRFSIGLAIYM